MLTSINVKFIFDSARLGLFSSTSILQIAPVTLWVVFLLFFAMFLLLFCLVILLLKRVKCPQFLFSQPKQLNLNSRSSWLMMH